MISASAVGWARCTLTTHRAPSCSQNPIVCYTTHTHNSFSSTHSRPSPPYPRLHTLLSRQSPLRLSPVEDSHIRLVPHRLQDFSASLQPPKAPKDRVKGIQPRSINRLSRPPHRSCLEEASISTLVLHHGLTMANTTFLKPRLCFLRSSLRCRDLRTRMSPSR